MHAGVHARSRRRAAFPLQEPRPPLAAAADARPAPPPAQSPPPVALARPLPSLCSAGRLWVLRAVICTRAPRVAASARAERPAPGARGAPSQRPSDNERRRGGRGEQVSGLRAAAAALGVGAVVRRRRGRAGVGGGRAQRAASGEAVLPSAARAPGCALAPVPAGAPLPPRHPRSRRTNKAPYGGGACLLCRARSWGRCRALARPTPTPYPQPGAGTTAPAEGGGRRGLAQVPAREAAARKGGRSRAPGPEAGPRGCAAAPCGRRRCATRGARVGDAVSAGGPDLFTSSW